MNIIDLIRRLFTKEREYTHADAVRDIERATGTTAVDKGPSTRIYTH